jgi:DNA-directed RNA polymerase specialized sigma subunit
VAYIDGDEHFRQFGDSLQRIIARYGDVPEEEIVERQRQQVKRLVALETRFRHVLIAAPVGEEVYRDFVRYICDVRRNILAARPFFRERQDAFTRDISTALKRRQDVSLYHFRFNYQFVSFVVRGPRRFPEIRPRKLPREAVLIAKEIEALRTEIVEMNLPLAINRASIFWRSTRQVRQQFMDLVQTCAEGLIAAVDKFCLSERDEEKWNFPGVAIGRMVGNLIEESSTSVLHFYPNDQRKLYRALKVLGRNIEAGEVDFERLADRVNEKASGAAQLTSPAELASLLSAVSCVSIDTPASDDPDAPSPVQEIDSGEAWRPDVSYEHEALRSEMRRSLAALPVLHRKVLQLRGVS